MRWRGSIRYSASAVRRGAILCILSAHFLPIFSDPSQVIISGSLDNNTPPFQADEVRRHFKQSAHIVVENAGHESMLDKPETQQAIVDFLLGKDVSRVKIALP